MRQRYTIDLERMAYQTATVDVVARDFAEAQEMATEMTGRRNFQWNTERRDGRVTKVICHAEQVPDEPDSPPPVS